MDKEQPLVEAVAVVLASVRATLTATQVENEKLREALEQIATVSMKSEYAHQLRDIARKALEDKIPKQSA
jgi:hypothetical protein